MSQLLNNFRKYGQDFLEYCTTTFFKSGVKGYLKFGLASYFTFWGLHWFARLHGLLPKKSVKGSHIFITGAGSGIGRLMALKFAKLDAKVTITDVNLESVQILEKEIKALGKEAKAIYCDVSDVNSVKAAAKEAVETYGDVEILINNAGIVSGKKILEVPEKLIEKTIQVNTVSHGYTVKEFLPAMIKKNKGHIVSIASSAGLIGVTGLVDYCASKWGAVGFDESLRMELRKIGSNVKTTCVCPYFISTGMFEGARSRLGPLMPILTPEYAANRIVNAILQEEKVMLMPISMNLIAIMRIILPVWLFDASVDIMGANASMDHFVGRNNKA